MQLVPSVPQTSQDICCVVFAIFNVIWSTLFLEEWKRRGAEFAYKWGTLDTPAESIEEPRPQFRVSPGGGPWGWGRPEPPSDPNEPPRLSAENRHLRDTPDPNPLSGSALGPTTAGVMEGCRGAPRRGEGHTAALPPPPIRALRESAP